MRTTAQGLIPRPVDEVWEILSDHEGMSGWAPGLKVSLVAPGRTERNGVGAVRRIRLPVPAPAIVEEITVFRPGSELGYRAVSGVPFQGYSGSVVLRGHADGTVVDWTLEADDRFPGEAGLLRLVARVLLRSLARGAAAG